MQKIFIVTLLVLGFFSLELALVSVLDGKWHPEWLLLLTVFFNLCWGIRYSIFCGVLAGVLRDSISITGFGFYIVSLIICTYLTTFVKRYLYHNGSGLSVVLIVGIISLVYFFVQYALMSYFQEFEGGRVLPLMGLSRILLTILLTIPIFRLLRRCVLKLSV